MAVQNKRKENFHGKARRRRKRRKLILFISLLSLFIAVMSVLSVTIFFNVEEFIIETDGRYSNAEILAAAGLSEGMNMFRIDKFKMEENIERLLPYIEKAQINRKLPNKMVITTTAATPFSYVEGGGDYILLSSAGKVLENVKEAPSLAKLIGSGIVRNTVGTYAEFENPILHDIYISMYNSFAEQKTVDKITELNLSKSYDITFEYEGNVYVHFGTSDKLSRKSELFRYIISREAGYNYGIVTISDANLNQASFFEIETEEEYSSQKYPLESAPEDTEETSSSIS